MADFPRAVVFSDNPHRPPEEKPVYSVTAGQRWDSVLIEISVETYSSAHFKRWLDEGVLPRLKPGGSIRLAILDKRREN